MTRGYYTKTQNFFQRGLTPGVKLILIVNAAVFFLQIISSRLDVPLEVFLGLSRWAWQKGLVFQLFTYMWLHDTHQFMHIVFNLFGIWMFGRELELAWGKKQFLTYYLVSGIGAGFVITVLDLIFGSQFTLTIGASGALFGLLLASAMSWPNQEVYLYFLFPVKMKYFVTGFGIISFLGLVGGSGDNISHSGHLGGLLAGYLYIQYKRKGLHFFLKIKKRPSSFKQPGFEQNKKSLRDNVIQIKDSQMSGKKSNIKEFDRKTRDTNWEKKRVDELLDRISTHGLQTLTEDEKRFLNRVSKNFKS